MSDSRLPFSATVNASDLRTDDGSASHANVRPPIRHCTVTGVRFMTMRRAIVVGLACLLSGCGSTSSTSPSSLATPTFPEPPRLVSPASGAVLSAFPRTTTLTWTTVTGATGYGLDIEYCLPTACFDGTTVPYPPVTLTTTTYTFDF